MKIYGVLSEATEFRRLLLLLSLHLLNLGIFWRNSYIFNLDLFTCLNIDSSSGQVATAFEIRFQ